MIKYLGSKRVLIPRILGAMGALPEVQTVLDLFSGTSRVGHACKRAGYRVMANDHNRYAAMLARCYVAADLEDVGERAQALIAELQQLPGSAGWFTDLYCEKSRYLQAKNGARIEAIRERIAGWNLDPDLEAVLLVSLMEAADRVDSTTGVQMAYLKQWSERSHHDLELRLPDLLPRSRHGKGAAHELDACEAALLCDADVVYLDPPYNQHKYLGNYHVWESLMRWDQPAVFGIAQKRIDCKERRSDFNSTKRASAALQRVIARARAKHLVVSFSDEGHVRPREIVAMLRERGFVWQLACDHQRYIGARIGIYSPRGEKVGTVSHLRNREFLFVVSQDRTVGRRLGAQGFARCRAASSAEDAPIESVSAAESAELAAAELAPAELAPVEVAAPGVGAPKPE
jgi:adenine-specific DNA-methyltransferase